MEISSLNFALRKWLKIPSIIFEDFRYSFKMNSTGPGPWQIFYLVFPAFLLFYLLYTELITFTGCESILAKFSANLGVNLKKFKVTFQVSAKVYFISTITSVFCIAPISCWLSDFKSEASMFVVIVLRWEIDWEVTLIKKYIETLQNSVYLQRIAQRTFLFPMTNIFKVVLKVNWRIVVRRAIKQISLMISSVIIFRTHNNRGLKTIC